MSGGEYWLHGSNICLIPGKLFWNRGPKESGPALLAAVSILGSLRPGRGGLVPAQLTVENYWEPLDPDYGAETFPFVFPTGTMQFMTLETGSDSWMPTMMGPAAP